MQGVDQHGQQTEIPDPWLTEANPWEVRECFIFTPRCSRRLKYIRSPSRQYRQRPPVRPRRARCGGQQPLAGRRRGTCRTVRRADPRLSHHQHKQHSTLARSA